MVVRGGGWQMEGAHGPINLFGFFWGYFSFHRNNTWEAGMHDLTGGTTLDGSF